MRKHTIAVKHNIEVAHRLFLLPGKCENIHGHSMWVTMELEGELNKGGILGGIEYGDLKKMFRGHLDAQYDHRVLLNYEDPWAEATLHGDVGGARLPGLNLCPGDPTTENIAMWIANSMKMQFLEHGMSNVGNIAVTVWETSVNMASYVEGPE